jgi:hypothetical protein
MTNDTPEKQPRNKMSTITYQNVDENSKINLHDAELGELKLDYRNKQILIKLRTARWGKIPEEDVQLEFFGVKYLSIGFQEPWEGQDFTVADTGVQTDGLEQFGVANDGENFLFGIELHTGDQLKVVSTRLVTDQPKS